jgi:hypothetical protein
MMATGGGEDGAGFTGFSTQEEGAAEALTIGQMDDGMGETIILRS